MHKAAMRTVVVALLAHAAVVSADDESASAALKRGKAAFKAGRVHEACEAFEASEKLEAKPDTEISLAECYEQDGKPVAASHLYRTLAENDTNVGRRKGHSAKVTKLEAKAPKLRIVPNARPDGLVIKVDGVVVPTTGDVLVDAGPHEVTGSAPGFEGHASAPVDRERQIVDVILRLEATTPPPPEPTPPPPPPTPTPTPTPTPGDTVTGTVVAPVATVEVTSDDHHTRNGAILAASGVALIVVSAVLIDTSSTKFNDEHNLCPNAKCPTDADLATANSELSDGHTERGLAIGLGIGGVAALGVGAYILFAGGHKDNDASHVSFKVGHGNGALTYSGHF